MANYEVKPDLIASRIPRGTQLDLYDNKCFVSLVGFMFLDTRVMDFLIPGHINFEEVNLRFYVKRETKRELRRGVVFIKEIVPRSAIAFVARALYGEPYERWEMSNTRDPLYVEYRWHRRPTANRMSIGRGENRGVPEEGSHGEFIIEHYWGYTKRSAGRTDEYKVEHPQWDLFEVHDPEINVDFAGTYGADFAFLDTAAPHSVLCAAGSEISVYKGESISD